MYRLLNLHSLPHTLGTLCTHTLGTLCTHTLGTLCTHTLGTLCQETTLFWTSYVFKTVMFT
jgi:hypothetical protein